MSVSATALEASYWHEVSLELDPKIKPAKGSAMPVLDLSQPKSPTQRLFRFKTKFVLRYDKYLAIHDLKLIQGSM